MRVSYMIKKNITILIFCASICIGSFAQEKNLALNKPVSANSENSLYPAKNIVDGKITRHSKWMSANVKPPHILEINLQQYCNINKVVLYTGIPELERTAAEATQAAGFWSAKNFKLQYWDDANWTDMPHTEVHENRLTTVPWSFSPAINTFKLRFICDDGEPISVMEIEVFGTETNNRPVAGAAIDLQKKKERTTDQQVTVKISDKVIGKTMKYVGYNQGYYLPGSNVSGWLEYSTVNSVRLWASLNAFVPEASVQVDNNIFSVVEFDRRKNELRQNPEHNRYIQWNTLTPLYDKADTSSTNAMVLNYAMKELKRLDIDVILQISSTDFDSSWSNKWKQWQRFYALAYYAAKEGDVAMFSMQNEPNHRNSGPMKLDQWIMGMQIVSDAVHSAVEDVNKKYGKQLKPKFVGPVTAGNNPEWWAAVSKNLRTDYHGQTVDKDLIEIFSTHSYNSPAAGYESRINAIRKIIMDNHPAGKPLPIVYTEIGRWMNAYLIDKDETMDSPSLFTEWAGIYTNNTLNGGYGMWAFKFANTVSSAYPRGIKSGHHFTWQGKRIVEDAYKNIAFQKKVTASSSPATAAFVTDNNKTDASAWIADSSANEKWLEIDLGKKMEIGSAVIYTGSASGIYTAPDRVKNFTLKYFSDDKWNEIPGAAQQNNKYAQVFTVFKNPVVTDKIRFLSGDKESAKVREIKLFLKEDDPVDNPNFNISGIQRTGQVVRLFAKGFKEERPLMETTVSVADVNLDALTSFDQESGNYYVWLVQRGLYKNNIELDLGSLGVSPDVLVTAETVGPVTYGEVHSVYTINKNNKLPIVLPPQTVMLLTISPGKLQKNVIVAAADATVTGEKNKTDDKSLPKELFVALDAEKPENNQVSYIRFNVDEKNLASAKRVILKLYGHNATDQSVFRFHVYGMVTDAWKRHEITWQTAPLLDENEALIEAVGQKAFVAGELAMDNNKKYHYLDVTEQVKKYAATGSLSFALVRETRQSGDDLDKGKIISIGSLNSDHKPELIYWTEK